MTALGFIPGWQFNYNAGPGPETLGGLGFVPSWQLEGPVTDTVNAFFASWWWQHRKWVVLGGAALLGLGLLTTATAVLR
jgi:hypothetical protein